MKRSIETRINMSNAQRGEKGSRTDKIKYVFLSKEHGLFVGLRCNIIEKYGLDHSSVGMIINGKRKYHRGWVYIGEEKNVNFLETSWLNPELYNLNIKNKPRVDRCKRRSRIPAKLLNKHNQE
jgi:hypothetical protein